jgi:hypothetical protein
VNDHSNRFVCCFCWFIDQKTAVTLTSLTDADNDEQRAQSPSVRICVKLAVPDHAVKTDTHQTFSIRNGSGLHGDPFAAGDVNAVKMSREAAGLNQESRVILRPRNE